MRAAEASQDTVPAELREPMLKLAGKPVNEEDFRTFREDYEFFIRDRAVHASYSGHCQVCGLGTDFEHVHPIPGLEGN